jgi:hypothetical protein
MFLNTIFNALGERYLVIPIENVEVVSTNSLITYSMSLRGITQKWSYQTAGVVICKSPNGHKPGFDINFLTNLSIRASAILILLARNCKLLARILKCHICM